MPAERSGRLAVSPDWADGWCRTTAAASESRNAELAERIRVPALRTAPTCPACARTQALAGGQPRQTHASHNAPHANWMATSLPPQSHAQGQMKQATTPEEAAAHPQPSPANEHGTIAARYLSNSFILSEVRKALRHHPEATGAVRTHFDELADRLEAEGAGPQERERRAA
jgi:hypothetical protein